MPINARSSIGMLVAIVFAAVEVRAELPMIGYVFPAGGQRGTKVEARVGGCNLFASPNMFWTGEGIRGPATLNQIDRVWFEGPVIPQPPSQQKEDYPRDYAAPLVIGENASYGRHTWRTATSQGVTAAWGFIVGEFPEVVEVEQEGDTPAVAVSLPVTVNGRIFPREDVDSWKFSATAGQIITCHVATSELGSPLDARLAISDASGKILAESIPAGDVTPPLRLTIPTTGEYLARIHDISFQGLQNHVYRLTLTTGPVLDAVYPLGGRRGSTTRLQLDGVNLAESEMNFALPATGETTVIRLPNPQSTFGDVRLELDDFDELLESAAVTGVNPNDSFPIPSVLNGRIQTPGEEDVWRFKAVKGQEYEFDVHASRCGSPLDAVISVCDANGKSIQEADDGPGMQTDARLRWSAPDDGDFQIRIRDRLASRGGKRFAYRIRVTSATTPEFKLKMFVDGLNIERGQSVNLKVALDRGPGFKEPVEIAFEGLPPGVTVAGPAVIAANQQEIQIPLKAEKDAKISTAPVRVIGTAKIGDRQVKQSATMVCPAAPPGQDSVPVVESDSPLWMSVTIPTPFKFVGIFESKYVPRGGAYVRKYHIERNGFDGPLEVELADRQGRHLQGVTACPVIIEAGKSEFEFVVDLPPWMEVGRTCRSTLAISGVTTDPDGAKHTISFSSNDQNNQMIALVATGRLTIQLPQSTLTARPGERVELPIKIQRSPGISGAVQLEAVAPKSLEGLSATPATIASDQNSATLVLNFSSELKGVNVQPLTIRATTKDERNLPVTAESKLTLVDRDTDSLVRPTPLSDK